MTQLIIGSILLSLLHALIPSHWIPVLAISRKENWSWTETFGITLVSGLAHAASTVAIGVTVGLLGMQMSEKTHLFAHVIAPSILVLLGLFFLWQHHRHKHFHLHAKLKLAGASKTRIALVLMVAMFLSPCLEIEGFFLAAGAIGWHAILVIAILYSIITVAGMVFWVRWAYHRMQNRNWHNLEHRAGMITGWVLVATGAISYLIN